MKLLVKKGTTSKRAFIEIQDSSSTTGAFKTGLTSSSLTCAYSREDDGNAASTVVSLSAGTRGTWSSGGVVEKDSTNSKGEYELGLPNAALASGSNTVIFTIQDAGSNNVASLKLEIQLVDFDPQDAVRMGMTALPNVASGSAGAIPTTGTGANQINVSGGVADANLVNIRGSASQGAAGYVGIDWSKVNSPTTTLDLSGTTIKNLDNTPTGAPTNWSASNIDSSGRVLLQPTQAGVTIPTVTTVTNLGALLDVVNTAQTHNVNNSVGKQIRLISGATDAIFTGTVSSATSNTLVLPAGASSSDGAYSTDVFSITLGTGQGSLICTSYVGSTRTATFANQTWSVTPVNGDTVEITPSGSAKVVGYFSGQDPGSLVLKAPGNLLATDANGRAAVQSGVTKNVAVPNFTFLMTNSTTHAPQTGLTVTATRRIDSGSYAACANAVTEVANGLYTINLAASDMNGAEINLRFTATGADDRNVTILTTG